MKRHDIIITLFIIITLLMSHTAFARMGYSRRSSSYLVCSRGNLPLVSELIKVNIKNQVAITSIEMTFDNPYDVTIQPNIKFPIHEKASVQNFSLTDSDGKLYEGKIQEKEQAKATFEAAKAEGMMPALVVHKKPGIFETSIGAIAPKSQATVIIEYSEILTYDKGNIQYNFPFSVSSWQKTNLTQVSFNITIEDQKDIIKLSSKNYDIYANKENPKLWNVSFEKADFLPEKDFDITYEVRASKMVANLLSTKPVKNENGYFVLMLSPQEDITAEDIVARDIVFIIDTSGSMGGQKLKLCQTAFNYFIEKLNANDRFSLVSFSSYAKSWSKELLPVTPENRAGASKYINELRATGGTNISDALLSGINLFDNNTNRTKAIVFLTDGRASAGETSTLGITSSFLSANTNNLRTFCIGVGRSVNNKLLGQLASQNRGKALYLEAKDNLDTELKDFYQTISTPLMVDLSLDWGDIKVSECYPKTLPNIYKGTQLIITGRYSQSGVASITLNGKLNGKEVKFPVAADFASKDNQNSFTGRYWAIAKANDLMAKMNTGNQDPSLKEEVIRLSKTYQFTTPYTSFIAISSNPVPNVQAKVTPKRGRNSAMVPTRRDYKPRKNRQDIKPRKTRTVIKRTKAKSLSLWGANGFLPIAAIMVPNFRKARQQSREKACYANMRVILGAVEMYNMDHTEMMNDLDIKALVAGKYLRKEPQPPTEHCNYGQVGNLDDTGRIICQEHGTVEEFDPNDGNNPNRLNQFVKFPGESPYYSQKVIVKHSSPWKIRFWNNFVLPFLNIAINVPLLLLGLYLTFKILFGFTQLVALPFKMIFSAFTGQDDLEDIGNIDNFDNADDADDEDDEDDM